MGGEGEVCVYVRCCVDGVCAAGGWVGKVGVTDGVGERGLRMRLGKGERDWAGRSARRINEIRQTRLGKEGEIGEERKSTRGSSSTARSAATRSICRADWRYQARKPTATTHTVARETVCAKTKRRGRGGVRPGGERP